MKEALLRLLGVVKSANGKESVVLGGLAVVLLGLAASFAVDLWAKPSHPPEIPPTPPEFTNAAPVRVSAAELFRTDGDTSGLTCSSCHEETKPVTVHLNTNGVPILPEAHKDLTLRHGPSNRNDHCFNCHDSKNLEMLRTREGKLYKITESTPVCGSCHGPTLRDWERGLHGRTDGYWDRKLGKAVRLDCTSCHDPHAPGFPPLKAGPGPYRHQPASTPPGPAKSPAKGH